MVCCRFQFHCHFSSVQLTPNAQTEANEEENGLFNNFFFHFAVRQAEVDGNINTHNTPIISVKMYTTHAHTGILIQVFI